MKSKRKNYLTFGDLVAAAYRAWGTARAREMMQLAIKTRLVVLKAPSPLLVSGERTGQHE